MLVAVIGCVPISRTYHQPYYEGGTLFRESNCGTGERDSIAIELGKGAALEMSASSSEHEQSLGSLSIHGKIKAPDGIQIGLLDENVTVRDLDSEDEWQIPIEGIWVNQNGAYVSLATTRLVEGKTESYELWLGGKRSFNTGFSFSLTYNNIPRLLKHFSVELPAISVSGEGVHLKPIQFTFIQDMGVAPLNC